MPGGGWANAYSPDGTLLATAQESIPIFMDDNEFVQLWDLATGEQIAEFSTGRERVERLTYSADGSLLVGPGSNATGLISRRSELRALRMQIDDLKKKIESLTMLKESITRPYQSLDSKQIILTTLEAIHQDFKFERLTAMETDPVYRNLTAIESLDTTDLPIDLNRLNLNLKDLRKSRCGFVSLLVQSNL